MKSNVGCWRQQLAVLGIATSWITGCAMAGFEANGLAACPPVVEYSRELRARGKLSLDERGQQRGTPREAPPADSRNCSAASKGTLNFLDVAAHWITLASKGATMTPTESKTNLLSLFFAPELRAWFGRSSLAVVFWGYGVAMSMALATLHATVLDAGQMAPQQVLIVASAAYTAWILVAIWRCPPNASQFWGTLARWLTVAWALNTAFVLLFLQIELMLRYAVK